MLKEIWIKIDDRENKSYYVSNYGNCKIDNEILNLKPYKNGYYGFCGNLVHRWVAELFIPNPAHKYEVDHIDGNKLNNHVNNLRWVTHKENCNNPITLKTVSEGVKRKWNDQNFRNSVSVGCKIKALEQWKNNDNRQKIVDAMKRKWQDPEYRQKISESIKGKHRVYDNEEHTKYHYE